MKQYKVVSQDREDMGTYNAFDAETAVKYMYMDNGYSASETEVAEVDDSDYDYSTTAEGEETKYFQVHYLMKAEEAL